MKRLLSLVLALFAVSLATSLCFAQTEAQITVNAAVDEVFELGYGIKKYTGEQIPGGDPGQGIPDLGIQILDDTMNFELSEVTDPGTGEGYGQLAAEDWYVTWLSASTSGRPYIIQQDASSLTDGTNQIPDNCYLMVSEFNGNDEWQWPGGSAPQEWDAELNGGVANYAGSAVGTDIPVWTSGSGGEAAIARAYHSITNGTEADGSTVPGFSGEAMDMDQPAGSYSGTLVFELVLQTP